MPTTAPAATTAARTSDRRVWTAAVVLLGAIVVSIPLATALGAAVIAPADTAAYLWAGLTGATLDAAEYTPYTVVWEVRAPRVALAALVGAGLATVGVLVQVLVRNALADPFILGISAGASVGASAVVTWGALAFLGVWALTGAAFVGALGAAALVWVCAGRSTASPLRLVLVGVVLSLALQAVMSLIVFFAPRGEAARAVLFWLMGSLGGARWDVLPIATVAVVAGCVIAWRTAPSLDLLAMGDDAAASLGVDAPKLRRRLFVVAAAVPAALVAVCGAVGFVGLVVPHLVRLWAGPLHRRVLLLAPPAGAVLCIWVDVLCRVLVPPRELPFGVVTALLGVPVFLMLLRRRDYVFGGR